MKKRRTVALLIETSNHFARQLLHGIRGYIREHEPWLIRLEEQRRGEAPPRWLGDWKCDGIIARLENETTVRRIQATKVPAVNVSAVNVVPGFPCVKTDDEGISQLAADYFVDRGLKHFAYLSVPEYDWSRSRREHFVKYLGAHGFSCEVFEEPPSRGERIPYLRDLRAVARWVRRLPKPVGLLAAWDGCGSQILAVCQRQNIHVPEEIAVLGVDNDELLCDLAEAPLSSIDPNAYRIGYKAAELLDQMMGGRRFSPGVHLIPPLAVATRVSSDILAVDDPWVASALRFIRHNAFSGIRVQDVLKEVPLSRRILESRFRKLIGRTPHKQILSLQLERVRSLLSETALNLSIIAERAGFNHVEYMSVAFKREFGVSPSVYRSENAGPTKPTPKGSEHP